MKAQSTEETLQGALRMQTDADEKANKREEEFDAELKRKLAEQRAADELDFELRTQRTVQAALAASTTSAAPLATPATLYPRNR